MKTTLALLALPFFAWQATAAGFDCSLTNLNETEKAVCNTPYLSGLDNITNKLFISAVQNTLSKGTLLKDQSNWLKTRNACGTDIACIKDTYIYRNGRLSNIEKFKPVSVVFAGVLDKPLAEEIHNPNGFTIRDNPWNIKMLFIPDEKEKELNLTQGYWRILDHMIVDDDLLLFFSVRTHRISYVVMISEVSGQSAIIESYDSESKEAPTITRVSNSDSEFIYFVQNSYDAAQQKQVSAYYKIRATADKTFAPEKVDPPNVALEDNSWTGYCGDQSCEGTVLSPDGRWRLIRGGDITKFKYEGVYYFPKDRPDQRINVFSSSAEDEKEDWSYSRNFAWGSKDTFFFDNEGGLACIWKTDINNKTTERILPVEGLKEPYYIHYNNEDYVVSFYTPDDDNNRMAAFYIARASNRP